MKFQYFVGHVFDEQSRDDLRRAVREGMADFEETLIAFYADDVYVPGDIFQQKIAPAIDNSVFCIFDLSDPNRPNVFLELGYALGRGRPSVLLCRKGTPFPANLAGFDRIIWSSYQGLAKELNRLAAGLFSRALASLGVPDMDLPASVFRAILDGGRKFTAWDKVLAANGASTDPIPEPLLRLWIQKSAETGGPLEGDLTRGLRFKEDAIPVFKEMLRDTTAARIAVFDAKRIRKEPTA